MTEAVMQAHDRLHKEDIDGCHELLHQALEAGELDTGDVAPLADLAGFDADFRQICVRHNVRASFVAAQDVDERQRLLGGGNAQLAAFVGEALRRIEGGIGHGPSSEDAKPVQAAP
jgi:hypothetical protein